MFATKEPSQVRLPLGQMHLVTDRLGSPIGERLG
jgi:hypothetical protein